MLYLLKSCLKLNVELLSSYRIYGSTENKLALKLSPLRNDRTSMKIDFL